ncbi:MAG: HNH endonuclease [Gloeocapsa sp. UFS-A4-WI-NPMV-4B04]|nr:HNH endonuclease [Gloeocapsa sp. UFS-A4-WI-NPMV-4B04]
MCGESLYNGEELHLHHVKPKSEGGKDTYNNLRLLHLQQFEIKPTTKRAI